MTGLSITRRAAALWLAVGVCLAWPAGAAQAQAHRLQTGTRIKAPEVSTQDPAAIALYSKRVGSCLYRRNNGMTMKILASGDPVTVRYEGELAGYKVRNALEECMYTPGAELNFDARTYTWSMGIARPKLRAVLMEEDYLAHHAAAPAIGETDTENTQRKFVSTGDDLPQARGLAALADCTVFNGADRADALLRTEPGTEDENAAARALAPVIGACLPQGMEIEFTAATIRSLAADGLWARVNYGPVAEG